MLKAGDGPIEGIGARGPGIKSGARDPKAAR